MNYLPNIIPYTGNKFRHIKQILHNIPDGLDRFVDAFGGSGCVAINVAANNITKGVVYNDFESNISRLVCDAVSDVDFINKVNYVQSQYPLTKEWYLKLREDFNQMISTHPCYFAMLFVLISRSFNNQYRVNLKGQFNLPYGERSYLNIEHVHQIREALERCSTGIGFMNASYEHLLRFQPNTKNLVFFDPPYYNSVAGYNSFWSEDDELKLYRNIRDLSDSGNYFMMTNTLVNRGKFNPHLKRFMKDFEYYQLECNHNNSSYHKSDAPTEEYLIANFPVSEYREAATLF